MGEALSALMFLVTILVVLAGYPVAFTLAGTALAFGALGISMGLFEPSLLSALAVRYFGTMTNEVLVAVPLFVFMGVMLEKSGLAEDLLETMALLFGRVRGGLAVSIVVVGAMLGASTGIVGATVVTMGMLSLPTMLRRGYSREVAAGTVAASGTLGQIIPPSIVLVLLGSILNVSIGDMFMGAVIPGFGLVGLYLLWIVFVAIFRPELAPAMPAADLAAFRSDGMIRRILRAFILPFFLILAVLGSIFAGIASPTEAAAVGAFGATLLTIVQGRFSVSVLKSVMRETTHLTCMVFFILVGATSFGLVFRGMQGDTYLTNLILSADMGPNGFLALAMVMIFVAGFFIDFIEITFIIVPVVAPIFQQFDVDMLWLGILIAMNLQTSFLTPPFGFSLFYLKGVAPEGIETGHIYRGIVPFIVIQLIAVALVIAFPESATWFPEWLARK